MEENVPGKGQLKLLFRICLKGLWGMTKILSEDSLWPDRDLNRAPTGMQITSFAA
jgi:hypothetical protein